MSISQSDYLAMESRLAARRKPTTGVKETFIAVAKESRLHDDIRQECVRRGWLPLHGSMGHRTYRTPGEPDFVILTERRAVLLIECKSRTGKRSKEQRELAAWAQKLDHTVFEVRSYQEFLAICDLTAHWRGGVSVPHHD